MKRKFLLLVSAISLVGGVSTAGSVSATRVPEAKKKPLVVSAVYLNDLTACVHQRQGELGVLSDANPPCYTNLYETARYTTGWVFSVMNPNSKVTAKSVRVRLKMLDASGNEVVNKVVKVSANVFPGQTVWVTPTFDGTNEDPWEWELSETSGKAVSATATLLPVKWGSVKKVRTPTVNAEWQTTTAKACTFEYSCQSSDFLPTLRYMNLSFNGIIPNPSKAYSAYVTRVFFADDGTPLVGYRALTNISRGANARGSVTILPAALARRIGSVKYFVSR